MGRYTSSKWKSKAVGIELKRVIFSSDLSSS